ncbi:MAG: cysteine desulfurase CsdA, partial [Alphaproteobacteria bacterium CG_4_10_14_0_8_um_filter_53_9]
MTLISLWRDDFAALGRPARDGGRLAFFDSAASAQKPKVVVDALRAALEGPYAN